jgi:hypothetical protein
MLLLYAPASSLSLPQTSSDILFGDRNLAVLHIDFADWLNQKRIFSPAYYYEVGTSGNALKCRIIQPGL